jgi:hypothetical protein
MLLPNAKELVGALGLVFVTLPLQESSTSLLLEVV